MGGGGGQAIGERVKSEGKTGERMGEWANGRMGEWANGERRSAVVHSVVSREKSFLMLATDYWLQHDWDCFPVIYLWCLCLLAASPVRMAGPFMGG
jgi:hypothetical protein